MRRLPSMLILGSLSFVGGLVLDAVGIADAGRSAQADDACPPPPAATPGVPAKPAPAPGAPGKDAPVPAKADDHGIHNYFKLSEHLFSGAQPENDADFAQLAADGVKVVISVDGSTPDVEAAKRHGLRYVHVPIGYDGIPPEKAIQLSKAFTSLEGPFFVHCHHGKHRGPAACSIGRILLDKVTPEVAVAEMKRAGTDPKYRGLYEVPAEFKTPTAEELAKVGDLPSVAPVPAMQEAMVEADHRWDRIRAIRQAKWGVPKDHPDVDPAHEATMLAEWFRELARRPESVAHGEAFVAWLKDTETAAVALSKAVEKGKIDAPAAEAAFDEAQAACTACHGVHRDNAAAWKTPPAK